MKQHTRHPGRQPIAHRPGEVVLARVGNWIEDRNATGKVRPVVLVAIGHGPEHQAIALTTQPVHRTTGTARVPLPLDADSGLAGDRSYLWNDRTVAISRADMRQHLGWASPQMVATIIRNVVLPPGAAAELRRVAAQPPGANTRAAAW